MLDEVAANPLVFGGLTAGPPVSVQTSPYAPAAVSFDNFPG